VSDRGSGVRSRGERSPTRGARRPSDRANRKAIDRIRRENKRDDKQREAQMVYDDDPAHPLGAIDDERLRLIFTCCHRRSRWRLAWH